MNSYFKSDWLASDTLFYNTKNNTISKNINEVIDFETFEWDSEGLYNYLDFGYSILEQTPIKNVKFLKHSSEIHKDDNGKIIVNYLKDPSEEWFGKVSHEDDILNLLELKVRKWEDSVKGEIIVPTSGGYDSRLLNILLKDKSRIRSFTYGISDNQIKSYEVVYAKKISEILNTKWQQIELGNFHDYFEEWDSNYGVSTHAHGMYHIEFYNKIRPLVEGGNPFLSGLIGDAWAGRVNIKTAKSINELHFLGYSHGLKANVEHLNIDVKNFETRTNFFEDKASFISNDFGKIIESMRFKIILLNYLQRIPQSFGFNTYSPFLDIDIALSMLTLPDERRKDRIWQKDFFEKNNLILEDLNLNAQFQNSLDTQGATKKPLKQLSETLLSEIINPNYVRWINKNACLDHTKWTRKLINKLPFINDKYNLEAYNAYMTILPLQKIIEKRNEYFKRV